MEEENFNWAEQLLGIQENKGIKNSNAFKTLIDNNKEVWLIGANITKYEYTTSFESKKYDYLGEERTFNEDSIVEELEELVINDINIGEADRARLEETKSENPNLEKMIVNEKRLRKANEGRARNKNKIDKILKSSLNE